MPPLSPSPPPPPPALLARLNDKTGCKKYFRVDGPEVRHRNNAVQLALFWCDQAKDFPRQKII